MRFTNKVTIRSWTLFSPEIDPYLGPPALSPHRLIIVAIPKDKQESTPAVVFDGGLDSNIPVIVVTKGEVLLRHITNPTESSNVGYLSIVSSDVYLRGPEEQLVLPPGQQQPTMKLFHLPSTVSPILDPLMDILYGLNVLPAVGVPTRPQLTQVPGTWQDLTAKN
jgi:hypothetical protein